MADQGNPNQSPTLAHPLKEQPIDQGNKKLNVCEIVDGCKKLFEEAEQIMVMVNQWKAENNSDTAQPTDEQRKDLIRQLQTMISNAQSIQSKLIDNGLDSTTPSDNVEAAKVDEHLSDELTDNSALSTAATQTENLTPKSTDSEPALSDDLEDEKPDEDDSLEVDKESTDDKLQFSAPTTKAPSSANTEAQDNAEESLAVNNDSSSNTVEQVRADEQVSDQVTDQSVTSTNQPVEPASFGNVEVEKTDMMDNSGADKSSRKNNLSSATPESEQDVFKVPEAPLLAAASAQKQTKPEQQLPAPMAIDTNNFAKGVDQYFSTQSAGDLPLLKEMKIDEVSLGQFVFQQELLEISFTYLFNAMEDISSERRLLNNANCPKIISDFIKEIQSFDKEDYNSFDPLEFALQQKEHFAEKTGDNVLFYYVFEHTFLGKKKKFEKCAKDLLFFIRNEKTHLSKRHRAATTDGVQKEVHLLGGYEKKLFDAIDTWKNEFWNESLRKYLAHQEKRQKREEPTGDGPTFEWKKEFLDYKKSKFFKKRADYYASLITLIPEKRAERYNTPLKENDTKKVAPGDPKMAHMKMMAEAYRILAVAPNSEVLNSDFDYLSHLHQDKQEEHEFSAFTAIFSNTVNGSLIF